MASYQIRCTNLHTHIQSVEGFSGRHCRLLSAFCYMSVSMYSLLSLFNKSHILGDNNTNLHKGTSNPYFIGQFSSSPFQILMTFKLIPYRAGNSNHCFNLLLFHSI